MMRAVVSITFLLALSCGIFAQSTGGSSQSLQARLCYVDMVRVLEAHKGMALALEEAKAAQTARADILNQKREEIRVMREDLDLLIPGTPEHLDQLKRIQVQSVGLELDGRMAVIEFNIMLVEKVSAIYKDCLKAVGEVAAQKGYSGAMAYSTREIGGRSFAEFKGAVSQSGLVWHDETHDITKAVEQRVSK